ncbi:BgtE-20101 [Blumeria graminis f. sp. tritici]|uniref:BgtE-20101 n=2 Tax=Blumeria graminis TaxID=34373 RepID=A0A9X9LA86_BLUGR|nr:BgtE-20101 [Blumeria graminis f. sp. tritici]
MKFLNVSLITTTLSLFTSFGAAQAGDEDIVVYDCFGTMFYLESVCQSALRAHQLGQTTINGYPTRYNAQGLNGPSPHKLFPMFPNVLVYGNQSRPKYFLIVDNDGYPQGMVHLYRETYHKCSRVDGQ